MLIISFFLEYLVAAQLQKFSDLLYQLRLKAYTLPFNCLLFANRVHCLWELILYKNHTVEKEKK